MTDRAGQNKGLGMDIFRVCSSHLVVIVMGIANGFLVPRWLGVDGYAEYKTFMLYAGYVGVLHFGYADGIYLKYGGRQLWDLDHGEISGECTFLFLGQVTAAMVLLSAAFVFGIGLLVPVALLVVPANMTTFFYYLYQATGRFRIYARFNALLPLLGLVGLAVMIGVAGTRDPGFLIGVHVTSVWMVGLGLFFSSGFSLSRWDMRVGEQLDHVRVGLFVMLGNLAAIFLFSMDRWFVKLFLSTEMFAYYSFAVSMMGLILTLVAAVAMTFYPLLTGCMERPGVVGSIRDRVLVFGGFGASSYFVYALIVQWFLPDYRDALDLVAWLCAGIPVIGVINTLYVNLYKAAKQEQAYCLRVGLMVVISCFFDAAAVAWVGSGEAIALATTTTFFVWFFLPPGFASGARPGSESVLFLLFFLGTFVWTVTTMPPARGLVVFVVLQVIISRMIMPDVTRWLLRSLRTAVN